MLRLASTLKDRIVGSIPIVHRIGRLPVDFKQRAAIIRTRIFPRALYGVEIAEPPENLVDALNAAVASTITRNSGNRSLAFLFSTGSHGDDLDAYVNIAVKRIMTLKRMITKRQHTLVNTPAHNVKAIVSQLCRNNTQVMRMMMMMIMVAMVVMMTMVMDDGG